MPNDKDKVKSEEENSEDEFEENGDDENNNPDDEEPEEDDDNTENSEDSEKEGESEKKEKEKEEPPKKKSDKTEKSENKSEKTEKEPEKEKDFDKTEKSDGNTPKEDKPEGETSKEDKPKKKSKKSEKSDKKEKKSKEKEPEKEKEPPKEIIVKPFTVKIKNSKIVKGIFDSASSIISETHLNIDPEKGMSMSAMDGSHICLVSLNLVKSDFDEFDAKEKFDMGLNIEDVNKVLKRAGGDDEITFSMDTNTRRLVINMKPEGGKKIKTFNLALMNIEAEEVNMDSLENMAFENEVEIDSAYIDEALKDAEIFSDAISIKAKGDAIEFATEGSLGDVDYVLDKDSLIKATFTADGGCTYGISFLKSILKIATIENKFKIQFGNEQPLHIEVKLLENSSIVYYLAPRVDEQTNTDEE